MGNISSIRAANTSTEVLSGLYLPLSVVHALMRFANIFFWGWLGFVCVKSYWVVKLYALLNQTEDQIELLINLTGCRRFSTAFG